MTPETLIIPYQQVGDSYQLLGTAVIHTDIFPDADIKTKYVTLLSTGELIIEEGFAWDGGSGPAINNKTMLALSLPHDALYKLMRLGLLSIKYRRQADLVGYHTGLRAGMLKIRAIWVLFAVKTFARRAALQESRRVTKWIRLDVGNITCRDEL